MPRCKNCKDKFDEKYFLQKYCMKKDECITAFWKSAKKEKVKKQRKALKAKKESLKTITDYLAETQKVFNTFIKLRDKGKPCISCKRTNLKKVNAGHYIARNKSKLLTFNEDNVHLQCEYCNNSLSGNLIEYRKNLIEKIGEEKVKYLEEKRHETKHYTREELNEIKEHYKQKIKEYEND